jgi:hypothetical protein
MIPSHLTVEDPTGSLSSASTANTHPLTQALAPRRLLATPHLHRRLRQTAPSFCNEGQRLHDDALAAALALLLLLS